jgi:hypothetical protein
MPEMIGAAVGSNRKTFSAGTGPTRIWIDEMEAFTVKSV